MRKAPWQYNYNSPVPDARPYVSKPRHQCVAAGFHKDFNFTERTRLRWEMTAVNFFNHPNWSNPGTDMTDTTGFGVITSAGGVTSGSTGDRATARAFRMGLRLQF
jgi:hypothetical protein